MNTIHGISATSDEHDLRAMLREANELRTARGVQQLGPWWHVQRRDFCRPRFLIRARLRPSAEVPVRSTPKDTSEAR